MNKVLRKLDNLKINDNHNNRQKSSYTTIERYLHQLMNPFHKSEALVRLPFYMGGRTGVVRKDMTVQLQVNASGHLFFSYAPWFGSFFSSSATYYNMYYDNSVTYNPSANPTQSVAFAGYYNTTALQLDSAKFTEARLLSCGIGCTWLGVSPTNMTGSWYAATDCGATLSTIGSSINTQTARQNDYSIADILKLESVKDNLTPYSTPRYTWRPRNLSEMTTMVAPSVYTSISGNINTNMNFTDGVVMVFTGCNTSQTIAFDITCVYEVEVDPSVTELALGYSECYVDPCPYIQYLSHEMNNFVAATPPSTPMNLFYNGVYEKKRISTNDNRPTGFFSKTMMG